MAIKTTELVCDSDLIVTSKCGFHKVIFKADVPRNVPNSLVADCRAKGAFPAQYIRTKEDAVEEATIKEASFEDIVQAVRQTLDSGDKSKLTGGLPRVAHISDLVGSPVTKQQIMDATAQLVESEPDASEQTA